MSEDYGDKEAAFERYAIMMESESADEEQVLEFIAKHYGRECVIPIMQRKIKSSPSSLSSRRFKAMMIGA